MINDPWGELARVRQQELLSCGRREVQARQARRARRGARWIRRRPLYLRWLAILFGPR